MFVKFLPGSVDLRLVTTKYNFDNETAKIVANKFKDNLEKLDEKLKVRIHDTPY